MELGKQVGKRIKELREEAGLTQRELAESVGMAKNHLSRLELGHRHAPLATIEDIAKSLGVDPTEFFRFPESEGKA